MTKLYGSNDPSTQQIDEISKGIGYEKLPIDIPQAGIAFQVRDYFGWDFHEDGQYTQLNKRALGLGTHQLTCDGVALTDESNLPNGAAPFWDVATNLVVPQVDGALNSCRFTLATSLSASTAKILLVLRSATTSQVFASHNEQLNSAFGDTIITFNTTFYADVLATAENVELAMIVQEIQGGPSVDVWGLQVLIGRTA
jgi:hypothetical protein